MNLGREVRIHAAGQSWRVGPMRIEILDKFVEWVKPQLTDPVGQLAKIIDKMPRDVAEREYVAAKRAAEELDALDWDSPPVQRFQKTKRGAAHLFLFMLQAHKPDATLSDAFAIASEVGPAEMQRVIEEATGQVPGGNGQAPAPAGGREPIGPPSTAR